MLYHRPIFLTSTDVQDEPSDDFFSTRGVGNLWVKLDAVEGFGVVHDRGIWSRLCMSNDMKIWWDL